MVSTPGHKTRERVSTMVAAKRKDVGKTVGRISRDPEQLIKFTKQIIADVPGPKVFSILDARCSFWHPLMMLSESLQELRHFMATKGCSKCHQGVSKWDKANMM